MVFRRNAEPPPPPERQGFFLSRMAWVVLGTIGAAVVLRATVATVVTIHGNGMAPTIWDDDMVLVVRAGSKITSGDVVVYEPIPANLPADTEAEGRLDDANGSDATNARYSGSKGEHVAPLPNAAVVDKEELERNWQRIRGDTKKDTSTPRALRLGRVLAAPGDTVAFNVPGAALGIAVNGIPLRQKAGRLEPKPGATSTPDAEVFLASSIPAASIQGSRANQYGDAGKLPGQRPALVAAPAKAADSDSERELPDQPESDSDSVASLRVPAGTFTAWESMGETRYPVFPFEAQVSWDGMGLPDDDTPLEMQAEGYLILADNRKEGACCDSRVLGWISAEYIEGEVFARMTGEGSGANGDAPVARGMQWLP